MAMKKNTYGNKKYQEQMLSSNALKSKRKKNAHTIWPDGTSSPKTKKTKDLMDAVRKQVAEEITRDKARRNSRNSRQNKKKEADKRKKKKGISKPKDSFLGDTKGIIRYI